MHRRPHPLGVSRPARAPGLLTVSLSRALGLLYVVGAVVALVWVWLPHDPHGGDDVVVAMALLAVALGTALGVARDVPLRLLHVALGAIQVVIAVAYVAEGRPDGDVRLFFLWATPYAALYFGLRAAAAHLAWTAAVSLGAVLLMPGSTHRTGYDVALMLLATLAATGALAATAAVALRAAERAQRHDATHDGLTGLANRRRLLEVLHDATTRRGPPGDGSDALLLFDLDGFKSVNDRYGHAVGDELLRGIADRLREVVRAGDLACRLGGDEFAVLARGVAGPDEALALAGRAVGLTGTVEVSAAPGLVLGASAGVRMLGGPDLSASHALRDADAALYAAKRTGVPRPHLWTPGMRHDAAAQLELAEDLRLGMRAGQLHLVYQPVVDIATRRVTGLEALARWNHPVRGAVPPVDFVAAAERAGLVGELTRWVLFAALHHAATWPVPVDGPHLQLAVNLSAAQLGDLRVVADVRDALTRFRVYPADVVLEVTETAAAADLEGARRTLAALADLGVGLALDDFGTGAASLTYVQALPFDRVKVDREFVRGTATGDRRARSTVAAAGALAAQLQLDVVAEGVEDAAELPGLQALGCRHAQGFGLARPMGAAAVNDALTRHGADAWVLGAPCDQPVEGREVAAVPPPRA